MIMIMIIVIMFVSVVKVLLAANADEEIANDNDKSYYVCQCGEGAASC